MIEDILNEYEKIKVGNKEIGIEELKDRIRDGEERLRVEHRNLDKMSNDELADYFLKLARKWKDKERGSTPADIPEAKEENVKNIETDKIHKEENIENIETDKTDKKQESESEAKDLTDSNETQDISTVKQLPDDINQLLQKVADRYDVEAEAIYKEYLELRAVLDRPYPLNRFKKVLQEASNGCIVFEAGFIRPLKLDYTDKLTHNRITVYRLTEDNSKDDIIKECRKAEVVCYELGASEKHILTKRAKSVGQNKLEQASKGKLLEYLWQLYDLINERLTKLGGETNGKDFENADNRA